MQIYIRNPQRGSLVSCVSEISVKRSAIDLLTDLSGAVNGDISLQGLHMPVVRRPLLEKLNLEEEKCASKWRNSAACIDYRIHKAFRVDWCLA